MPGSEVLPDVPSVPDDLLRRVERDYERFAQGGPPPSLDEYLREEYRLDLRTRYAGFEIPNPWGKASGQLSMTARQVAEDAEAGLGFVVLKTVIAEDEAGARSMEAWAIREARMLAEPIVGRSGQEGWTVSWKGRGWWHSFADYLQLVREAREIAHDSGTLIVPSCKYHLPTPDEARWKEEEYAYTTRELLAAWGATTACPMPIEKDFSPTLAGSDLSRVREKILEWLRVVPRLVREAGGPMEQPPLLRIGLKLFNALFDDAFQLEMLRSIHEPGPGRPDFFVYANRLFDPGREFEGHRGIAYGGPDLSDRNLRVMSAFRQSLADGEIGSPLEWSATGNITTGKMALEYALRGASSFQLHTFFQLPADQYRMKTGSKTEKALHELTFHPQTGLVVWMHHVARALGIGTDPLLLHDIIGTAPRIAGC